MKQIYILAFIIPLLAGSGMKEECDQQRAEFHAPERMRPMKPSDLSFEDMNEIRYACDMRVEVGDIQGKRNCKDALVSAAITGRQVVDTSYVRVTPANACSFPWNK